MGELVNLADFQKPVSLDAPISDKDKDTFALDLAADEVANDMVLALMLEFNNRFNNVDNYDPIYEKLMEGMADLARSMVRNHLDVFDITTALLQKYPNANIHVGVMEAADQEDA